MTDPPVDDASSVAYRRCCDPVADGPAATADGDASAMCPDARRRRSATCPADPCRPPVEANDRLRWLNERRRALERKAAELDRTDAEAADLRGQLADLRRTFKEVSADRQKAYDDTSRDLDAAAAEYERTTREVDALRRDNRRLKRAVHAAASEEQRTVSLIGRLEAARRESEECVCELRNELRRQLVRTAAA